MFEKNLPKHKDMLDATFLQPSFKTININIWNINFGYILIDFHNCFYYYYICCEFKICSYINTTKSSWSSLILLHLHFSNYRHSWALHSIFVDVVNRCTSVSRRLLRLNFQYANVSLFVVTHA
jgi:hypothetical protein